MITRGPQAVTINNRVTAPTDWPALVLLYGELVRVAPTLGARLGHAAALAETGDRVRALAELEALPTAGTKFHQPFRVLRAHFLAQASRTDAAATARARALELTADPAVRALLAREGPDARVASETPKG